MPRFTLRDVFWATGIVAAWAAMLGWMSSGYTQGMPFLVWLMVPGWFGTVLGALIGSCFGRAMLGAVLATALLIAMGTLFFVIATNC